MKSKLISISAIATAFVAIFLTVGAYITSFALFCLVVSSVFLLLPLQYGSYKATLLTYLSAGFVTLLLSGLNILSLVFPAYFGFFGIYPVFRCFASDKNFNKFYTYLIGLIWCIGAVYGIYFLYINLFSEMLSGLPLWLTNNLVLFVPVISAVLYFIYDYSIVSMRRAVDVFLKRTIK